jgi:hypothetical protein
VTQAAIDDIRKRLQTVIAATATADDEPTRRPRATTPQQQRDAIEELRRSQEELARKVAALEDRSALAVKGLLDNLRGLKSQALGSSVQQVNSVVNSTQAAAYGQRGSVFATNNLLLAGNQLLWTIMDPLLRAVGVSPSAAGTVAVLAPVGSLITGHIALGNRQHVRFITGVANFPRRQDVLVVESLRNRVADSFWPAFQQRRDVPVAVVRLPPVDGGDGDGFISEARVRNGVLIIRVDKDDDPAMRVAWTIDLGPDIG